MAPFRDPFLDALSDLPDLGYGDDYGDYEDLGHGGPYYTPPRTAAGPTDAADPEPQSLIARAARAGWNFTKAALQTTGAGAGVVAGAVAEGLRGSFAGTGGPSAYERALRDNMTAAGVKPATAGLGETLRAMPAAGQVAAEAIAPGRPSTMAGRLTKRFGGIVGDMALDPATWASGGAKQGIRAAGLAAAAAGAGRIQRAAALTAAAAKHGLASPTVALVYGPELVEAVKTGAQQAAEHGAQAVGSYLVGDEERAGRAFDAALESGIETVGTAGLGSLIAHGAVGELRAPGIERAARARAAESRQAAREQTAFEQGERDFLTPDRQAAADAEQLRLAREYMQERSLGPAIREATSAPPALDPRLAGDAMTGPGADMVRLSEGAQAVAGAGNVPSAQRLIEAAANRRSLGVQRFEDEALRLAARGAEAEAREARRVLAPPGDPRLVGEPDVPTIGTEDVGLSPAAAAAGGLVPTRPEAIAEASRQAIRDRELGAQAFEELAYGRAAPEAQLEQAVREGERTREEGPALFEDEAYRRAGAYSDLERAAAVQRFEDEAYRLAREGKRQADEGAALFQAEGIERARDYENQQAADAARRFQTPDREADTNAAIARAAREHLTETSVGRRLAPSIEQAMQGEPGQPRLAPRSPEARIARAEMPTAQEAPGRAQQPPDAGEAVALPSIEPRRPPEGPPPAENATGLSLERPEPGETPAAAQAVGIPTEPTRVSPPSGDTVIDRPAPAGPDFTAPVGRIEPPVPHPPDVADALQSVVHTLRQAERPKRIHTGDGGHVAVTSIKDQVGLGDFPEGPREIIRAIGAGKGKLFDRIVEAVRKHQGEQFEEFRDRAEQEINRHFEPLTPDTDIPLGQGLSDEQRAAEARARAQLLGDIEGAVERYRNGPMPEAPNGYGNVINTDDVRTMFPDYQRDRSGHSQSVHEPSSRLSQELFRRGLLENIGAGRDVVFLAGGTGAGKTSAVKRVPDMQAIQDKALMVYDSNFNGYASAKRRIEATLASGNNVTILFVWRDPVESLVHGVLPRAMGQERKFGTGRAVPLFAHEDTHFSAPETAVRLAEEFADDPRVQLHVLANETGKGARQESDGVAFLKNLPYYLNEQAKAQYRERFNEALEAERAAGRISEALYRGVRGKAEAGVGGAGDARGADAQPERAPQDADQLAPRPPPEPEAAAPTPKPEPIPVTLVAESRGAAADRYQPGDRVIFQGKLATVSGRVGDDLRIHVDGTSDNHNRIVDARKLEKAPAETEAPAAETKAPAGETRDPEGVVPGTAALVDAIASALEGGSLDNVKLRKLATEHFGGTRGQGTYTPRDMYDAQEAAVNRLIERNPDGLMSMAPADALKRLREIVQRTARQTDRTKEQVELQQFSTPPTEAYVAAKALGIRPDDVVLEPSAGTGGLAVFAQAAGAEKVHVNEIAPRRVGLLKLLGFDPTTVDAEQLHNLLPDEIKPTAILMNPPFSSTGERVARHDTAFGAQHVRSALERLADGGRLVAIVGRGMALDRPKLRKWWDRIAKEYNVRANIRVDGREYGKYGTTFDNQLVVIDKTGPTESWGKVVTQEGRSLEETLNVLEPVIADRPTAGRAAVGRPTAATEPAAVPERGTDLGDDSGRGAEGGRGAGAEAGSGGGSLRPGRGGRAGRGGVRQPERPGNGADVVPPSEPGRGPVAEPAAAAGGEGPVQPRGGSAEGDAPRPQPEPTVAPDGPRPADPEHVETGNTFVAYKPAKLKGGNFRKHPAKIVEAASMAAVEPPDITYTPQFDPSVINEGKLSEVGYESVAYAGQRHSQMLPPDKEGKRYRGGYFVGDGTGTGKGRIIAGIIGDNWNRGRKKSLWLSVSNDLQRDAIRDRDDVGFAEIPLHSLNTWKPADAIDAPNGIMFSTYNSLVAKAKGEQGRTRLQQLREWLGPEPVIVFDEAHKAKNLVMDMGEGTQTGKAVEDIQNLIPDARVVYVSATGATDVRNMAYMTRLGLWGEGTPFKTFGEFLVEIENGGVGAMEMVARDLKALGLYNSRSISFDGVEYRETRHDLTPEQTELYNTAGRGWQKVLQKIDTVIKDHVGGGRARKSRALSLFYAAQQRFFNTVLTAMQVPAAIRNTEKALKEGHSVIISLKNTNEATAERKVNQAVAEKTDLDAIDFTPRDVILRYVDESFPTIQMVEESDPKNPNVKVWKPLIGSDGKPVHNKRALAEKQALMDELSGMRLPDNPLDQIVNHFGEKNVAEMTGRKRRLIRNPKTGKTEYRKRAGDGVAADKVNQSEMTAFQDGKKRIAIISGAASTGISLHAENRAKNKQRRYQIALQLGWSADAEMQTFGRSHRSNQASAPIYDIITTNVGGQRRFFSTIARRLASLGALSKGQRDAASAGDLGKYNFESKYGRNALVATYNDLRTATLDGEDGRPLIPGGGTKALLDMGILKEKKDGGYAIDEQDLTNVPRFLNRVLALEVDRQNAVFDLFNQHFADQVASAKELGQFDEGVTDIKGEAIRMKPGAEPVVVHTHEATGAKTRHYTLEVDEKTKPLKWESVERMLKNNDQGGVFETEKGRLMYAEPGPNRTTASGQLVPTMRVWRPSGEAKVMQAHEFYKDAGRLTSKVGREKWEAAVAAIPKIRTRDVHIIGGAITPIWDRLQSAGDAGMKVVRLTTDDGQRVVGVRVSRSKIQATLRALGVGGRPHTADGVYRSVWEDGESVDLVAGLKLRKVELQGESRIEVVPFNANQIRELRGMGAINEQINYAQRFFVPSDEAKALPLLETILKRWPVFEKDAPSAGGDSAAAALDRLKERAAGKAFDLGAIAGEGAGAWRDVTVYGAHLISQGVRKFGEWAGRMLADLGDVIGNLPRYLRAIYARSRQHARQAPAGATGAQVPRPRPAAGAGPGGPRPPPNRVRQVGAQPSNPANPAQDLADAAVTASNRAARIADTFQATNDKLRIALEGAERIAERGTIEKGERRAFRAGGQPDRAETRTFRQSEADIQQAGAELVAAVEEFKAAERLFAARADPNSAAAMKVARNVMEQAVKNWQVYRSAAGRQVQSFNRGIPEGVIQRLREAGLIAGHLRAVKERVPIATNILRSIGNFQNLTPEERKQFVRDLVDHFRLNLFSVTSWTLDLVGNAAELAGQAGGAVGRDLVHVVRGNPTFPSMQGLWRTIRAKAPMHAGPEKLEKALEFTAPVEQTRQGRQGGVFTYRGNKASTIYDFVVGGPLYAKQGMDRAAQRLGAMWTVYREAIEEAQRRGLHDADRESFIEGFVNDIPEATLRRAVANGRKAGFSRELSDLEERMAGSVTARLLVDTFMRWPFQFARWGAEMLGWNPDMYRRFQAGELRAEDVGEYLAKTAVGLGGLYLINSLYDRVDFNSMEYVDEDGDRIRLANRDPIPTALWLLATVKGDKEKAAASLRHASVPFARLLVGEGGILGSMVQQFKRAIDNPQNNPRALAEELADVINRAIPGQAVLSALKTLFDPTIREGVGANLPGVSLGLPAAIDPVTGGPLQPRQKIKVGSFETPDFPSIGGTPIPGATRVLDPVQKLLARYGLQVYRGPRAPIAGFQPSQAPPELREEWEQEFGAARQRILAPLARSLHALEQQDPEKVRKEIQKRDRAAAEIANRILRRRHGGPKKLPRQPTQRELAGPDVYREDN